MTTAMNIADRRSHSRIELQDSPPAAITGTEDNLAVRVKIMDISLGGARVQVDRAIDPARRMVELMIDGVRTVAEIVWRTAGEVGLRYVEQAGDAAVSIFEHILNREFGATRSAAL